MFEMRRYHDTQHIEFFANVRINMHDTLAYNYYTYVNKYLQVNKYLFTCHTYITRAIW